MDSYDLEPDLIHGSLDPQESTASQLVQPFFAQHIHVTSMQTDRHTDHTKCDTAIGRVLCTPCGRCGL